VSVVSGTGTDASWYLFVAGSLGEGGCNLMTRPYL